MLDSHRLPADVRAVAVALAEHADDEMMSAPGIAKLRASTDLLEWKVIRALHDLQLTGHIVKVATAKPFLAESHDSYKLQASGR
ncbi:hypothetical protein NY08_2471 [Rhodococcus sp. B7740]|nr:hypothetical protein NY08_2471 [Rhodococcus sp. B7740]